MRTTKTMSSAQLSLFPYQGTSVNDTQNGNRQIAKLFNYLKTRGGLWRLLALFPGNMPVEEALRLAPYFLTLQESGFIARFDGMINCVFFRQGDFIIRRKEVAIIRRKEVAL